MIEINNEALAICKIRRVFWKDILEMELIGAAGLWVLENSKIMLKFFVLSFI